LVVGAFHCSGSDPACAFAVTVTTNASAAINSREHDLDTVSSRVSAVTIFVMTLSPSVAGGTTGKRYAAPGERPLFPEIEDLGRGQ
jgi:hypothetical protein